MKLIFFLLVLLKNGTNLTEGLQVIYSSGQIILKYFFHWSYNSFEKCCCKFDPWNCFVNSRGHVAPLYKGRISISNNDGGFEVRISDLSVKDAGIYRCGVRDYSYIYQVEDVEVTVSGLNDLIGVNTTPFSAKSTIKTVVWRSSSPSTAIVSEDAQKLSDDWRTSYTLAAVLSVLVFAVISMTLLVCLKTRKKKSTEKIGTCGSANTTLEQNGIIYSMVDFTPHQDPSELYANLQIHSPENTDPSSRYTFTTEESVEYSTILRAPA